VALERTATGTSSPSAAYAARIAASGSTPAANGVVVTAKPPGTGKPARIIVPRLAALPPTISTSVQSKRSRTTAGQRTRTEAGARKVVFAE
jgi:hypothetical protein